MNKSLINIINIRIIKLPNPCQYLTMMKLRITFLDIFLIIQFITGILVFIHYCPNISLAFQRILHIIQNMNNG